MNLHDEFCQRHFIKAHPNLFKPLMKFGGAHEEDISIETCDPLNTKIAYEGLKKICAPQSLTPTRSLRAVYRRCRRPRATRAAPR